MKDKRIEDTDTAWDDFIEALEPYNVPPAVMNALYQKFASHAQQQVQEAVEAERERILAIVTTTRPVISGNLRDEGEYWTETFRHIILQTLTQPQDGEVISTRGNQ